MSVAEGRGVFDGLPEPRFGFFEAAEEEQEAGSGEESIGQGMASGSFESDSFLVEGEGVGGVADAFRGEAEVKGDAGIFRRKFAGLAEAGQRFLHLVVHVGCHAVEELGVGGLGWRRRSG